MEKVFEKNKDIKLLIAGECYENKEKYLSIIKQSKYSDKIFWKEMFIQENEISTYFSASDVVVLPYKSASQSGVIPLAYHYNKPVITSDLESLKEVVIQGKTGFIFKLDEPDSLSSNILQFFENYDQDYYKKNIELHKKNFSWSNFVKGIENLFNRIDGN